MSLIPFTEKNYNALVEAYSQGVSEMTYGDKTIKFRTKEEMRGILMEMQIALNKKGPKRRRQMLFSKGLK